MQTLRQDFSKDLFAVTKTISKTSSESLPVDPLLEIFLRLPAKSLARFRCVSKLWASILRLPYFTDLFFSRSSVRPQLLFFFHNRGRLLFFSSSQHEGSTRLTADFHTKIQFDDPCNIIPRNIPDCLYINGLVFLRYECVVEAKMRCASVICNPSTGQFMTLPEVVTRTSSELRNYIGYDPIQNQHKVLSITMVGPEGDRQVSPGDHQILTLGTGKPSWKKVECCIPYYPRSSHQDQICINGVLYYSAFNPVEYCIIICFHVRMEKFSFIKDDYTSPLINYNGKLASLGFSQSVTLRVLEDVEKHEWSEHVYSFPASWNETVGDRELSYVGVTRTNEIVFLFAHYMYHCVLYYDTESNTFRRVEVRGMEAFSSKMDFTLFIDHVEDLKLINESHV